MVLCGRLNSPKISGILDSLAPHILNSINSKWSRQSLSGAVGEQEQVSFPLHYSPGCVMAFLSMSMLAIFAKRADLDEILLRWDAMHT